MPSAALVWPDGRDLDDRPLIERKKTLQTLYGRNRLLFVSHISPLALTSRCDTITPALPRPEVRPA